jgi:hypothetical protein
VQCAVGLVLKRGHVSLARLCLPNAAEHCLFKQASRIPATIHTVPLVTEVDHIIGIQERTTQGAHTVNAVS